MGISPRRRKTVLGTTAFGLATLMAVAGLTAPAAAVAPSDSTASLAQFLDTDLLAQQLLTVGTAQSGYPSGPPTATNPLNLQALQALGLDLRVIGDGLEVPLITDGTTNGLLNLGQVGAVQNYAATTPTGAVAASGLVSNDGTIAISENASPTDMGNASINLTSLLGQLGIAGATGPVIDQLSLEIGALASRIESVPGQPAATQYRVADLKAKLHSALVATLSTQLRAAGVSVGGTLTTSVNGLVGTDGVLTRTVAAVPPIRLLGLADVTLGQPTVAVDIANLGAVVDTVLGTNAILVSDDRSVTIDLTTGTVTLNLAAIVNPGGTNLNGRPANTSVLTAANILTITNGVTNALGKITTPLTTALGQAVRQSTVTVSVQVRATLLPILGNTGTLVDAPITIRGTLQQLATGGGTVDTSQLKLLPGIPLCIGTIVLGNCVGVNLNGLVGALVSSVVTSVVTPLLAALGPAVTGVLTATDGQIATALNGVTTPLVTALNPVLSGVLSNVVDITINEQPQLRTPAQAAELGAGSSTVRALSVTLLPRVLGTTAAKLDFASSTVRAQTIDIVQSTVRAGNPITVNGSGWVAGSPVTVAFTNGAGVAVGTPVVATPNASGVYTFPFTVPVGTVGPVTATATQGVVTASDSVAVTAPPSVNILETAVTAGSPITVLGASWSPASPVTVVYSTPTGTIGAPATPTPLSDGTFSLNFTVPAGTVGPVTATATQGADVRSDSVVITPPGVPGVNIVQASVVEGDSITVTGGSWVSAVPVSVELRNGLGVTLQTVPQTPIGGNFSFEFTVPVGTFGPVTALATQGAATAQDSVLVTALPNVDIVETTVVEGSAVTVNGSDWTPGSPVSIRYTNGANAQIGDLATVTPNDSGVFGTTFTVPVGTPGPVTATATQGVRTDSDQVAVTALPIPPSMNVVQDTVVAGTPVTITGANWNPAQIVGLTFTNAGGTVGTSFTTPAPDGTINATFVVPVGTTGPVTATATQGTTTLTDTFAVTPAPAISIAETTVVEGDTVVVPGTNWIPNVPVTLTATDGAGNPVLPVATAVPGADGSFLQPWVLPIGTVGPVTIVATQAGSNPSSDSFAVASAPAIDITEDTALAGSTIQVTGDSWANSPLSIVFTDADGQQVGLPVNVTPGADGLFTAPFAVPAGTSGTLTATATQGARTATDTIAITLPASIDIVETTVVEGDQITVAGANFDPTALIALITVLDGDGNTVGTPFYTGISATGTFGFRTTVPVGTTGPVTVVASAGGASPSDTVAVTDAPSIAFTADTVVAGQPVTVNGVDWTPGAVTVVFTDGGGLQIGTPVTATASAAGTFDTTVTVPVGTAGPVTATASQGARTGTDTIAVTAAPPTDPAADILEDTVVAGDDITVEGVNWNEAPLTVAFTDGDSLPIGTPVTLTPAADGSFTLDWTVPVGTTGPVRATVTQDAVTATDTVAVTAAALGAPAIDIEQTTVVTGQPITVDGGNWAEGPLSIVFSDGSGAPIGAPVDVDVAAAGTFSIQWTVPPGTVGPVRAIATQGDDLATDTVAVTPAPVADITETTVVAGSPITVTGANWAAEPLTIVFTDGNLSQVGPPVTLTPAADGTFGTSWTVPVGTVGPVLARVTQDGTTVSDTVLVTAAAASAPAVDIVESTIAAGQPITVNGANWDSASDVSIVFTDGASAPIGTALLVRPAGDGTFTTPFTIPVGTTGPVRAIVTQGANQATDTVLVTPAPVASPAVDIVESTVVAGNAVTVNGTNWADAPLTIAYTDGNGATLATSDPITPVDGAFTVGFTVPVGTVGPVRATVTQGTDQATDSVAVTAAPRPVPTADITEPIIVAGESITITGTDWANSPLSIVVTDVNGALINPELLVTPTAGSFSTTFLVPVGTVGPVRATVSQGTDTATDTVVVTPAPAAQYTVDILETTVVAGNPVTVTGANWENSPLEIVFTDVNSAPIGAPVTLTPVDGAFSTSFTIPVGTVGPVRANVRQGDNFAADSVAVTPADVASPTANIVEDTVVAGNAVEIAGTNWADAPLTISYTDGNGAPVGTLEELTPQDGAFSTSFLVPVGTVGPLRANVVQGSASATDTVAVTPAPVPVPSAGITETTVVAGENITVTGDNWANVPLAIVFTDGLGTPVGLPVAVTPSGGTFSVVYTVPVGVVGTLRATVYQDANQATDTVQVTAPPAPAPTTNIVETTVEAGQPITVTGENWADTPVTITLTDGAGNPVGLPTLVTPVDGSFSTPITIPVGTTGPVRANVSQGDDEATDTVAVTPAPVVAPTANIVETTVEAGQPITVTGENWADTPVTITLTDGLGAPIGLPVSVTPVDGSFYTPVTIPVGTTGPVRATVSQGDDTATDTVAVTPAPVAAPTANIVETTVEAGQPITVTGENWADTTVTITLTDGLGSPIGLPTSVTPVDGSFSTPITIPVGTTGPVRATVSQGVDTSTDSFSLTMA
jgi:hypothetical protein